MSGLPYSIDNLLLIQSMVVLSCFQLSIAKEPHEKYNHVAKKQEKTTISQIIIRSFRNIIQL